MDIRQILILFILFSYQVSAQIVDIPDTNFKNALLNSNCVDSDNDGIPDIDADTNDDGEIQVSEAESVVGLYVNGKLIESMEGIQSFINMEILDCSDNLFASIDLSQNSELIALYSNNNPNTTELNFSNNTILEVLSCYGNLSLSQLDVTQNTLLEYLDCSSSALTSLDVTQNSQLKELYCPYGQLGSIDVSNNNLLEYFNCSGDSLLSVDVTNNPNLKELYCDSLFLSSLDLSQNQNLTGLHCGGGEMTELDLSQNVNLDWIWCGFTSFSTLDFSNNLNLRWVLGAQAQFVELDFSQNESLEFLSLWDNPIESLNIQNGNNEMLSTLTIFENPNLFCVQVDDVEYANNNPLWQKDVWTEYSEDCALGTDVLIMPKEINIYPNPATNIVNFQMQDALGIDTLIFYDSQGRKIIERNEAIESMDVSNLASGIYFVHIVTDNGLITQKIIKK